MPLQGMVHTTTAGTPNQLLRKLRTQVGVRRKAALCQRDGGLQGKTRQDGGTMLHTQLHSLHGLLGTSYTACSTWAPPPPTPPPPTHPHTHMHPTWNRRFQGSRPCRWCASHMPCSSRGTATARPPLMEASGRPACGGVRKHEMGVERQQ